MAKFENVVDETTGEIKAVKIGEKEYTAEEIERMENKAKDLESGYTKTRQKEAEELKALTAELEEYRKFDKLLESRPEVQKQIEELLERADKNIDKGTEKGNAAADRALAEVQRLRDELDQEKKSAGIKKTYDEATALINKELDAQGVTSERLRKAIINDQFSELMREGKSREKLSEDVKSLVAEFKKLSSDEIEALKKAGQKKQPSVPGKGGAGGITRTEERPLPGNPGWDEFLAKKRQEHLQSE